MATATWRLLKQYSEPSNDCSAATMHSTDTPSNRRDAKDAELEQPQPTENLSLISAWFERLPSPSYLCGQRVSVVALYAA